MHILDLPSKPTLLIFIITSLLTQQVNSWEPNYFNTRCNSKSGDYTTDSAYKKNLDSILAELSNKSSMSGNASSETPDRAYGLFYCRGDLDVESCKSCVQFATKQIVSDCPFHKEAVIWYQECTLRYFAKNSAAFLEEDGDWTGQFDFNNVSDPSQFFIKLTRAISPLINKTAYGSNVPGFAKGEVNVSRAQTLFCLVECSPFTTSDHCNQCLNRALERIGDCCSNGSTMIMLFNPSCQLRYDVLPFYVLDSASALTPGSSPASSPTYLNDTVEKNAMYYVTRVGIPVALALLLVGICLWQRTKLLDVINSLNYRVLSEDNKLESEGATKFSVRAMKRATGGFSVANKLGEGGFGAVYKGKLDNGEEVAVKRLSQGSGQGNEEFSIEVRVLAKLQHRNLVRLLGYCDESKEMMLVYEYVPNSSLDKLLFDSMLSRKLDWGTRYKIIVGVARGLQYLHNESRLNIVHRDLKASNILLDADMNPKIADFGLAKQIELDVTRGDTERRAGTTGYMAPELILYGQFSTKSDVYSFGVTLLEIVSGQKVHTIKDNANLVYRAWKLWGEGKPEELLDPTLKNDAAEVIRCIKIALLCVQEHSSTRPSMQMVLFYMNSNLVDVPSPVTPSVQAFDVSIATSIMNSSSRGNQRFRDRIEESISKESSEQDLYPCRA